MSEHQKILQLAADGDLPDPIDEKSGISLDIFEELYKAGLVQAIDDCSFDGRCYMEPRITMAGRRKLSEFGSRAEPWWRSFDRRLAVLGILLTILAIVVAIALA